ncbi:hypothetical protein H696_03326 [Fonticula alba]|uniref:Uncharacterized protein n=1 Tax=Fonticula alba TaxID=691883 RepID=A0A058Z7F0_FONAL|nr:hypothetical protein H696_03326 [Fonticula alba]KCV69853.1 hypothetical protein H696_03326 [Fonticula alba]|eukprot:XP_009495459.1 hypothetical protein H696_03326 [Fonticula alba]
MVAFSVGSISKSYLNDGTSATPNVVLSGNSKRPFNHDISLPKVTVTQLSSVVQSRCEYDTIVSAINPRRPEAFSTNRLLITFPERELLWEGAAMVPGAEQAMRADTLATRILPRVLAPRMDLFNCEPINTYLQGEIAAIGSIYSNHHDMMDVAFFNASACSLIHSGRLPPAEALAAVRVSLVPQERPAADSDPVDTLQNAGTQQPSSPEPKPSIVINPSSSQIQKAHFSLVCVANTQGILSLEIQGEPTSRDAFRQMVQAAHSQIQLLIDAQQRLVDDCSVKILSPGLSSPVKAAPPGAGTLAPGEDLTTSGSPSFPLVFALVEEYLGPSVRNLLADDTLSPHDFSQALRTAVRDVSLRLRAMFASQPITFTHLNEALSQLFVQEFKRFYFGLGSGSDAQPRRRSGRQPTELRTLALVDNHIPISIHGAATMAFLGADGTPETASSCLSNFRVRPTRARSSNSISLCSSEEPDFLKEFLMEGFDQVSRRSSFDPYDLLCRLQQRLLPPPEESLYTVSNRIDPTLCNGSSVSANALALQMSLYSTGIPLSGITSAVDGVLFLPTVQGPDGQTPDEPLVVMDPDLPEEMCADARASMITFNNELVCARVESTSNVGLSWPQVESLLTACEAASATRYNDMLSIVQSLGPCEPNPFIPLVEVVPVHNELISSLFGFSYPIRAFEEEYLVSVSISSDSSGEAVIHISGANHDSIKAATTVLLEKMGRLVENQPYPAKVIQSLDFGIMIELLPPFSTSGFVHSGDFLVPEGDSLTHALTNDGIIDQASEMSPIKISLLNALAPGTPVTVFYKRMDRNRAIMKLVADESNRPVLKALGDRLQAHADANAAAAAAAAAAKSASSGDTAPAPVVHPTHAPDVDGTFFGVDSGMSVSQYRHQKRVERIQRHREERDQQQRHRSNSNEKWVDHKGQRHDSDRKSTRVVHPTHAPDVDGTFFGVDSGMSVSQYRHQKRVERIQRHREERDQQQRHRSNSNEKWVDHKGQRHDSQQRRHHGPRRYHSSQSPERQSNHQEDDRSKRNDKRFNKDQQ